MEASLRIILLLVGIFIIAGIVWDTVRARRKARLRQRPKTQTVRMEDRTKAKTATTATTGQNLTNANMDDNDSEETITFMTQDSEDLDSLDSSDNSTVNSSDRRDRSNRIIIDDALVAEMSEDFAEDSLPDLQPQLQTFKPETVKEKETVKKETVTSVNANREPYLRTVSAGGKLKHDSKLSQEFKQTTLTAQNAQNAQAPQVTPTKSTKETKMSADCRPLVLHVMAEKANPFSGADLLEAFLDLHLYYGEMQLFHHHENSDGTGDIMFSVVSCVEPGVFDISRMDQMTTPGVSFFFIPSRPNQSIAAFELMLRIARRLADRLNGELQDEERKALNLQSIDRYRDRARMVAVAV